MATTNRPATGPSKGNQDQHVAKLACEVRRIDRHMHRIQTQVDYHNQYASDIRMTKIEDRLTAASGDYRQLQDVIGRLDDEFKNVTSSASVPSGKWDMTFLMQAYKDFGSRLSNVEGQVKRNEDRMPAEISNYTQIMVYGEDDESLMSDYNNSTLLQHLGTYADSPDSDYRQRALKDLRQLPLGDRVLFVENLLLEQAACKTCCMPCKECHVQEKADARKEVEQFVREAVQRDVGTQVKALMAAEMASIRKEMEEMRSSTRVQNREINTRLTNVITENDRLKLVLARVQGVKASGDHGGGRCDKAIQELGSRLTDIESRVKCQNRSIKDLQAADLVQQQKDTDITAKLVGSIQTNTDRMSTFEEIIDDLKASKVSTAQAVCAMKEERSDGLKQAWLDVLGAIKSVQQHTMAAINEQQKASVQIVHDAQIDSVAGIEKKASRILRDMDEKADRLDIAMLDFEARHAPSTPKATATILQDCQPPMSAPAQTGSSSFYREMATLLEILPADASTPVQTPQPVASDQHTATTTSTLPSASPVPASIPALGLCLDKSFYSDSIREIGSVASDLDSIMSSVTDRPPFWEGLGLGIKAAKMLAALEDDEGVLVNRDDTASASDLSIIDYDEGDTRWETGKMGRKVKADIKEGLGWKKGKDKATAKKTRKDSRAHTRERKFHLSASAGPEYGDDLG